MSYPQSWNKKMDNKANQILNELTGIASELQLIVDSRRVDEKEIVFKEYCSYNEALDKVQQAIAALNRLDISTAEPSPPIVSQPKKNLLARLREIQIEGEPDWSERHGEIL